MTETDQKLAESIDTMMAWMEQGKSLASEQAPLVVEEIIQYTMGEAVLWLIICTVALVAARRFYGVLRKRKANRTDPMEDDDLGWFGLILVTVISTALWLNFLTLLVKVIIAPRLVILDALKGLL